MARGGNRPGAGRRRGSPNKATAARQLSVAASGLAPLDYLLSVMRDDTVPRDERVEAAKAAAPYVHPRLATVDHKSSDGSMAPKPDRIIIEAASADSHHKAAA